MTGRRRWWLLSVGRGCSRGDLGGRGVWLRPRPLHHVVKELRRTSLSRFTASLLRRGAKDAANGSRERVPPAGFDLELFPALRGQSVEIGPADYSRRYPPRR